MWSKIWVQLTRQRSPRGESVQCTVRCEGKLEPASLSGNTRPRLTGTRRVDIGFQPTMFIACGQLVVTFRREKSGRQVSLAVHSIDLPTLLDVSLVEASADRENILPRFGIDKVTLHEDEVLLSRFGSRVANHSVDLPRLREKADLHMSCAVDASALTQIAAPGRFAIADIVAIDATLELNLIGPRSA